MCWQGKESGLGSFLPTPVPQKRLEESGMSTDERKCECAREREIECMAARVAAVSVALILV